MGSNIKGGGRAVMSEVSQEALIDLLMDHENSISDVPAIELSLHHRKRARKQFVKKMVRKYERSQLKLKHRGATLTQTKEKGAHQPSHTSNALGSSTNANVRIELAEALFQKEKEKGKQDKKKSKDDNSKSKKKNSNSSFKVGTKKVIVLPRTTSASELMKLAQSKLKMKKPVCAFIQPSSSTIFELNNNLASIDNGAIIYVSASPLMAEAQSSDDEADSDEEELDLVDPLASVKRAYERQDMSRRQQRCKRIPEIINESERNKHVESRSKLPVAAHKESILDMISDNKVVILSGATGSGKSTQVPQFLLERQGEQVSKRPYIVVTQPRIVAAISLAHRVASERGNPAPGSKGSSVGYTVRLDNQVDLRSCRIIYMTIGILLRMLVQYQPQIDLEVMGCDDAPSISFNTISHLLVDECHERDVNTDFALTILKGMMSSKSVDMPRLILMSATASSELFANYFTVNGVSPAIIQIPGRTFPVEINWLGECEKFVGKRLVRHHVTNEDPRSHGPDKDKTDIVLSPRAKDRIDNEFICALISKIVQQQQQQQSADSELNKTGSILVFLPGLSEINALARCLNDKESITGDPAICNVLTLHSTSSKADQARIFQQSTRVKIVLSTNIAETSLTIPDISHVIDNCFVKESRYNPESRIKELTTVFTSCASMTQRTGRAGRTSRGVSWRLCSKEYAAEKLLPNTLPEIIRTPLDELMLQICLLYEQRRENGSQFVAGVKPMKFLSLTLTPPHERNIAQACHRLLEVGALKLVDTAGAPEDPSNWTYRLTPLGYHLSHLPMDAKVGKLLIFGCIFGCVENALTVAAALSCTKSCFLRSSRERPLDTSARDSLIENGFGGRDWIGGTAKGDLIAVIAVYRAWKAQAPKQRYKFCRSHALDDYAMQQIDRLRDQFHALVIDAGLSVKGSPEDTSNLSNDDALLTSCTLVAGLYPNICTLIRPKKGGAPVGKLLTKDNVVCRASSDSFQRARVKHASESGRDAYAVYLSKHQTVGAASLTQKRPPEPFISEVNFVSRFALLLFGGQLELVGNALVVDGWLKFKVSDEGEKSEGGVVGNAVLILTLRTLLDDLIVEHIQEAFLPLERRKKMVDRQKDVIDVVRKLIADEA